MIAGRPFIVDEHSAVQHNPNSWADVFSLLFIDHPAPTGPGPTLDERRPTLDAVVIDNIQNSILGYKNGTYHLQEHSNDMGITMGEIVLLSHSYTYIIRALLNVKRPVFVPHNGVLDTVCCPTLDRVLALWFPKV